MRIFSWFYELCSASRAHGDAWQHSLARNTMGSSKFAADAEAALRERVADLGATIASATTHVHSDDPSLPAHCVELRLEEHPVTLWIYPDQVDVVGPGVTFRLEHWDAPSPADAIDRAVEALDRAIANDVC